MSTTTNDWAIEVRRTLTDPEQACRALGLLDGAKRQANGGLHVRCPMHGEKTASCSVTVGPDGTIRVRCFGCQAGGDVLTLVGAVYGLDPRHAFAEVVTQAATIAGLHELADEASGGAPKRAEPRPLPAAPPELPPAEYPDLGEVGGLWRDAKPCARDTDVSAALMARCLDPGTVDGRGLARAVAGTQALPAWAKREGKSWVVTGHRLILPVYDATGTMRSVRAWRTRDGNDPKRRPPAGKRASALVLANAAAIDMRRDAGRPSMLAVAEGEPDFLTLATMYPEAVAVIGTGSGSWTVEHANRIPPECRVVIRTHRDKAGDDYAARVLKSIGNRCEVYRAGATESGDENDALQAGRFSTDPMQGAKPLNDRARERSGPEVLTVRDLIQEATDCALSRVEIERCTTGVKSLDNKTGGMRPGHVWVFGADTSWGKSTLIVMWADINMALGKRVLIVSAEDAPSLYGARLTVRRAKVNARRFRDRRLTPDEIQSVVDVAKEALPDPVYLDARGKKAGQVAKEVRRAIEIHNIDLVMYDYLQEFRSEKATQDRRNEVSEVAALLREPIKALNKTGVIFSQITVQPGKKYPDKHSIRESRDVSNAAEAILLGFTPTSAIPDRNGNVIVDANQKCILVDKAKDGVRGAVPMKWNNEGAYFEEVVEPSPYDDFDDQFDDGASFNDDPTAGRYP